MIDNKNPRRINPKGIGLIYIYIYSYLYIDVGINRVLGIGFRVQMQPMTWATPYGQKQDGAPHSPTFQGTVVSSWPFQGFRVNLGKGPIWDVRFKVFGS